MEAEAPINKLYQLMKESKKEGIDDRPTHNPDVAMYSEEDLATILEVYDIITRREKLKEKSELLTGTQVLTKTKKKFQNFCESLTKDFKGVMRLYGKLDDKLYTAGLLLERGSIIAASFEDTDNKKIVFKEEAITQIKKKLYGTKGDLDVYAFNKEDMKKAREGNNEALLTSAIPLLSLGMKIRSKVKTWAKKTSLKSLAEGEKPRITRLRTEECFNLADFAHKISDSPPPEKEDKLKELRISDLNKKRFNEIMRGKRRKQAIASRKKKYRETPTGLGMMETPIDRLYQLVQKHNRLRIDDRLTHELGVSRSQLEGWAAILDRYKLVELHYTAIGKAEIRTTNNNLINEAVQ